MALSMTSTNLTGLPSMHLPSFKNADKENIQGRTLRSNKALGLPAGKITARASRPALVDVNARKVVKLERKPSLSKVKSEEKKGTLISRQIAPLITRRVQDLPTLPTDVEDIDENDLDNPQLCVEYAPLMYSYLRQLETEQSIKKDFLKNCNVNGKMRAVLIDWLIEVHHQFKLLQETLYMTIFLIDRYLQVDGLMLKRSRFQLLGVTAMFTASKVEEMYAPEINDFVYITDNAFTAADIRQMELKLLTSLNFALGRPLPLHFLRRNSKAGDVDIVQHTMAKYIVELAQVHYELAHLSPSLIAASSLYLSLLALTPGCTLTSVWSRSLEHYSFYTHIQLLPTVCQLAASVLKAGDGKLKAVYTKYCAKKMLKVAEMPELKSDIVKKMAAKHINSLK